MRRGLLDGWWGIVTGESPSVAMEGRCRFERLVLETEAVVSFLICGTCGGTVDQLMECRRCQQSKQAIVITKATQSPFPSVPVTNSSHHPYIKDAPLSLLSAVVSCFSRSSYTQAHFFTPKNDDYIRQRGIRYLYYAQPLISRILYSISKVRREINRMGYYVSSTRVRLLGALLSIFGVQRSLFANYVSFISVSRAGLSLHYK